MGKNRKRLISGGLELKEVKDGTIFPNSALFCLWDREGKNIRGVSKYRKRGKKTFPKSLGRGNLDNWKRQKAYTNQVEIYKKVRKKYYWGNRNAMGGE